MMHPDQQYTLRTLQHADLAHQAAMYQRASMAHATSKAHLGWHTRMLLWLATLSWVQSINRGIRRAA